MKVSAMNINLKQPEIVSAIRQYIEREGISLRLKKLDVIFTNGRGANGVSAELVISDEEIPGDNAAGDTIKKVINTAVKRGAADKVAGTTGEHQPGHFGADNAAKSDVILPGGGLVGTTTDAGVATVLIDPAVATAAVATPGNDPLAAEAVAEASATVTDTAAVVEQDAIAAADTAAKPATTSLFGG